MKTATTTLRRASVASLALMALVSSSSHGGSGGPAVPRAVYRLRIITAIQNQETASTILDAKLFLDGALVTDSPSPGGSGLSSLDGSGMSSPDGSNIAEFETMTGPVASGPHTFSIRVAAQTSTPNRYTLPEGFVDVLDPNNLSVIKTSHEFTAIKKTLATGQSIDLKFSVP
jgi:hypothetical protein